jgi:hypothetical protein
LAAVSPVLMHGSLYAKPPLVDKYGLVTEPLSKTKDSAGQKGVLGDVESRLWSGHPYRDANKGTWAHEASHGVSARIRNKYGGSDRCNGCYILQDAAVVLPEPRVDLARVAAMIPAELRSGSLSSFYQLYLVQSRRDWRYNTMYLWDEFNAYTTGTWAGIEHNIAHSSSTLNMCVMGLYCLYALKAITNAGSDITQASAYLAWNWRGRVTGLVDMARGTRMHNQRAVDIIKWAGRSAQLMDIARTHVGECWSREVFLRE